MVEIAEEKMVEITEEQRKRAEANRLAALAKRKEASTNSNHNNNDSLPPQKMLQWQMPPGHKENVNNNNISININTNSNKAWGLFPCKKIINQRPQVKDLVVVVELCTATEFSVCATPAPGSSLATAEECLRQIHTCLSSVHCIQSSESQVVGSKYIYSLEDYDLVVKSLKKFPTVQLQQIPWTTLAVIRQFSLSSAKKKWHPILSNHASDDEVDRILAILPKKLKEDLLPFQMDGVRFGLRRGGRCLIADEMGVGKTVQAIAIASCYMHEGPVLVVCPASMRCTWAEELERWLPFCRPADVHLVFGHRNNLNDSAKCPKFVVISYTMLSRLQKSMLVMRWGLMIVDESHNLRCTKRLTECEETKAVLDVARKIKRVVLLSGTPSLSRPYDIFHQINMLWPGLLGKDKYDFARNYCSMENEVSQGRSYKDFSKGIRLQELYVLLRETVMVRRLKQNVLAQLPPKRRQVIRLLLSASDITFARNTTAQDNKIVENTCKCGFTSKGSCDCEDGDTEDASVEFINSDDLQDNDGLKKSVKNLSYQEIGLAKLQSFEDWLLKNTIFADSEDADPVGKDTNTQKMVVFGHHLKVLDGIQKTVCQKGLEFVRIDGSTHSKDRQEAVRAFRSRPEVKIAIVGITAGGVGLDFSIAQSIVFVELPKSASEMIQAEDRAHRRGQMNSINIYIFVAKDTSEELHWQTLNKSLERTSSMMNGVDDCVPDIEVDAVHDLNSANNFLSASNTFSEGDTLHGDLKGNRQYLSTEEGILAVERKDTQYSESHAAGNECKKIPNGEGESGGTMDGKHTDSELVLSDVSDVPPDSLLFEVSANTGRIHLYACISHKDARPRQLELNFRPEDVDSPVASDSLGKIAPSKCMHMSHAYREAALTFIKEWNGLRPVERNRLFGRPLRLPLYLELSCMEYESNHGLEGLLKGGSKRRVASRGEISYPLPENATWQKISLPKHHKIKERHEMQGWTEDGQPLCKLCQSPCLGTQAKSPEYFEDLFCKLSCFEEFRMRTSQQFLREELFSIERGICTNCKLDCHKLVKRVCPLSIDQRREHILKVAPEFAKHKKLLNKLVLETAEGNAWHADHIVPVYRGGGECRLENMRTLCVVCHAKVTAEQQKDRHEVRSRAKQGLQITIEKFIERVCEKRMKSYSQVDDSSETEDDKDLLMDVSGSAYSEKLISVQSSANDSTKIDYYEFKIEKEHSE